LVGIVGTPPDAIAFAGGTAAVVATPAAGAVGCTCGVACVRGMAGGAATYGLPCCCATAEVAGALTGFATVAGAAIADRVGIEAYAELTAGAGPAAGVVWRKWRDRFCN
jgi:hypothetical protein